jgi:hypothetical protein
VVLEGFQNEQHHRRAIASSLKARSVAPYEIARSEKMSSDSGSDDQQQAFHAEVAGRFGVLPNFFCSAPAAPGLIEQLWTFALAAYLNNPLPSLFKERLFVYLSQFCPVRYCVIRHVGFLLGLGRPAGDSAARPQTVDDVLALLQRPRPNLLALDDALSRLIANPSSQMPETNTPLEHDLFDALTIVFLAPLAKPRARDAVRAAVGETNSEYLIAFLAFVRSAHYWTETHPEIECEPDVLRLMESHEELAKLLLALPT